MNDESPDPVELTRRYGLWNSARHFSWKRAIPEAQSDDRDALAVYWLELRDEAAKDASPGRPINAKQGVIAEKIDGLWIPRYYAVEGKRVAEPIEGPPAAIDGIECVGQAKRYAAARRSNEWHNDKHSPGFSDDDCPGETVDLDANEVESEREAAIALGGEIERRYAEGVVKQRLHQPELRKMTLDHHGTACAYCGMDIPQIVEAAHLVADSEGGAASAENTRPMCPNHHRAFDAGLLVWDGSRFGPADGTLLVGPAPSAVGRGLAGA